VGASRKRGRQAQDVIGVLDVGTAKAVCLIVCVPGFDSGKRFSPAHAHVLGIGERPTRGLTTGLVTELDDAEETVRAAVMQAERMAGVVLKDVYLGVACRGLKSTSFTAGREVEGRLIDDDDIDRLLDAGRAYAERDGRTLLHMNCVAYRIDDAARIADPRGMAGTRLAADLHAVTVKDAPLQNLLQIIEGTYLSVTGLAPAPYASGLAATTAEERHQGVVSIYIGAGTTGVSMFAQGHLLWTDLVPGGGNVASDLAQPASLAEIGEIAHDRMTAHLRYVARRVEGSGVAHYAERLVLTGGASSQSGMSELAGEIFARPVRLSCPAPLPGLPATFSNPAYATAIGLAHLALDPDAGVRHEQSRPQPRGYFGRVGQWLMESF
jgi:cell division protein FtsA